MTSAAAQRFAFPVSLDVTGRRCVVAGGGALAAEKATALRNAHAEVIEVPRGQFSFDLLEGTFLFINSGEDDIDAAAAYAEAKRRGVLASSLDDIPHCDIAFPSVVQRGSMKLAVSTTGKAPALARRVRLALEDFLPAALGDLVDAYDNVRAELLPRTVPFEVWSRAWQAALEDLDGLAALCADGRADEARARIRGAVLGELETFNEQDHA